MPIEEVLSLLWSPRAQFWFLYALFFTFATIIYSTKMKNVTILLFILSVIFYFYPVLLPNIYIPRLVANYLVFFMLGVVFKMYFQIKHFSSLAAVLSLLLAFTISQWVFHDYLSLSFIDKGVALFILTCVSIAFVISISSYISLKSKNCRSLAYIGASSMAIYFQPPSAITLRYCIKKI